MMFAAFALTVSIVNAGPISFFGVDPGANSTDPRPTSNSAAASFDAAASHLGVLQIITFESAPLGVPASNLQIAPGVFLSGTEPISGVIGSPSPPSGPVAPIFGYNATIGGDKYVITFGGALTLRFDSPILGFGAYVTGLQFNGETITFNDGSSRTIDIPNPGDGGGVAFVGFTDTGTSISSITLTFGTPGGRRRHRGNRRRPHAVYYP
jgi:hypothetical protein